MASDMLGSDSDGTPSRLEQLCLDKGLKMTDQRRIIARVLSDSADHPDVEQVYRRATGVTPSSLSAYRRAFVSSPRPAAGARSRDAGQGNTVNWAGEGGGAASGLSPRDGPAARHRVRAIAGQAGGDRGRYRRRAGAA